VRTDTTRCLNTLSGFHNNVTVYFQITPKSIAQKCFCRCDTTVGRKHGTCARFCSPALAYPAPLARALFGFSSGGRSGSITPAEPNNTQPPSPLPSGLLRILPFVEHKRVRRENI
jgi:hypothetical protein